MYYNVKILYIIMYYLFIYLFLIISILKQSYFYMYLNIIRYLQNNEIETVPSSINGLRELQE